MSDPFNPDVLRSAVQKALAPSASPLVPAGKTTALLIAADQDRISFVLAKKIGDEWEIAAQAEKPWNTAGFTAGVIVRGSW